MEIGSEKGSVVSAADELSSSSQQHSGNMVLILKIIFETYSKCNYGFGLDID
jgi:hypothetical protein